MTNNSPFVWVNTVSQIDFLLVGSALAYERYYKSNLKKYLIRFLITSFLAYVLVATLYANKPPLKYPFSITDLVGASFWALLLFVAALSTRYLIYNDNKVLRSFFQNRVIMFLGKTSYGLYLYHYIIFYFISSLNLENIYTSSLLGVLLTIVTASVSFYFFENRILKYKCLVPYKY